MKIIIAEKPSVARDIATVVGANHKKDGYIEGNGYAVTWAFGHLVTLAMPEHYGFEGFKRENLPILPDRFMLLPRQVKEGKKYKNDPGVLKQLKVIKELFDRGESIIVATDAGREGELIFRQIYDYLGCTLPFERLWISSLTNKAIKDGLKKLRPGSDYDKLYAGAKARSQADWLVGINASQALSISAGLGICSLGRVQTPTLSIICRRYIENKEFKPQTYFRLKFNTKKDNIEFTVQSINKFTSLNDAEEQLGRLEEENVAVVTGIERKEVRHEPPLLHNLTSLQKEANTKHGFSAEKTLNITQALYEAKKVSYPRTGSRYISEDVFAEIPRRIALLRTHPHLGDFINEDITDNTGTLLNKRLVNDAEVTDHHALIITDELAEGLSQEQQIIYDLIAGRMLESFSAACVKETTTVLFLAGGVHFASKRNVMLVYGWQAVLKANDEPNEEEDSFVLPSLSEGDSLPLCKCGLTENLTRPRLLHTEATLLTVMESAGNELDNLQEREVMKSCGIGTPATRASIIETLFSREYIRREKKSLLPTDKGLMVYHAVKDKKIADIAMTGQWENALHKITTGEMNAATFHKAIEVYVTHISKELLSISFGHDDAQPVYPCPKCKIGRMLFCRNPIKCNNETCGLKVFRSVAQKELTDKQLIDLLTKGKTSLIKGFRSNKTGNTFDAILVFDREYKIIFEFPPQKAPKRNS